MNPALTARGHGESGIQRLVVGAAIVRDGRVLAARRSAPVQVAGGWEFPGGKLEPGETAAVALERECLEELGVRIEVGALLAGAPIRDGLTLAVYEARLVAGEPRPLQDHDELRWLAAAELDGLSWLAPDRPAVEALRGRLG